MPVAQVFFHRLAASEYRAARDWYRTRSEDAATRFQSAIDRAVNRIEEDPDSMPGLFGSYRWVRAGRFPYVLIYRRESPYALAVVAVAHTSRRPGYWRRRKSE